MWSTDSTYGIMMIVVGTMMYGLWSTLVRLSWLGDTKAAYSSKSVFVIASFGKFMISLVLLLYLKGISTAVASIKSTSFHHWFFMLIPAIIYSITDNLDFWILQYMDPASFNVLKQIKILVAALLWKVCFRKHITKQQWVALVLLCIGPMLVSWPNDDDDRSISHGKMYVEWPMGPLLIVSHVLLSTVAATYTEFIYKMFGQNRSMHIDNLSLYFWGLLSNIAQYYYEEGFTSGLLDGFNGITYVLIANRIVLGLTVAYVMKYFTNIINLFMKGFAMIVSGILAYFIFGLKWTQAFFIGLCLVILAVVLFKVKLPVKKLL